MTPCSIPKEEVQGALSVGKIIILSFRFRQAFLWNSSWGDSRELQLPYWNTKNFECSPSSSWSDKKNVWRVFKATHLCTPQKPLGILDGYCVSPHTLHSSRHIITLSPVSSFETQLVMMQLCLWEGTAEHHAQWLLRRVNNSNRLKIHALFWRQKKNWQKWRLCLKRTMPPATLSNL